jgi:hypothetical protein
VVVVAPDGDVRVLADPLDAGGRFDAVIDEVAQAQTDVGGLLDRLEGGPVGVDVGDQEDAHGRERTSGMRGVYLTRAIFMEYTEF